MSTRGPCSQGERAARGSRGLTVSLRPPGDQALQLQPQVPLRLRGRGRGQAGNPVSGRPSGSRFRLGGAACLPLSCLLFALSLNVGEWTERNFSFLGYFNVRMLGGGERAKVVCVRLAVSSGLKGDGSEPLCVCKARPGSQSRCFGGLAVPGRSVRWGTHQPSCHAGRSTAPMSGDRS